MRPTDMPTTASEAAARIRETLEISALTSPAVADKSIPAAEIDTAGERVQPIAASEDTRLLDWLQNNQHSTIKIDYEGAFNYSLSTWDDTILGRGQTLRAAIRAAIAASPQPVEVPKGSAGAVVAPVAEPVAWQFAASFWSKFESIPEALRSEARPLYASPASPSTSQVAAPMAEGEALPPFSELSRLTHWLDAKYARHKEIEDHEASMLLHTLWRAALAHQEPAAFESLESNGLTVIACRDKNGVVYYLDERSTEADNGGTVFEHGLTDPWPRNSQQPAHQEPAMERQPLTDEQISDMWTKHCKANSVGGLTVVKPAAFARAVLAAHGIQAASTQEGPQA